MHNFIYIVAHICDKWWPELHLYKRAAAAQKKHHFHSVLLYTAFTLSAWKWQSSVFDLQYIKSINYHSKSHKYFTRKRQGSFSEDAPYTPSGSNRQSAQQPNKLYCKNVECGYKLSLPVSTPKNVRSAVIDKSSRLMSATNKYQLLRGKPTQP